MSRSNENNPSLASVHIGSVSSGVQVPAFHLPRKSKLKSAKLLNGAAVSASDSNYMTLTLKNGSTTIATLDTRSGNQGAISANVAKSFALVAGLEVMAAGDNLSLVYAENEGVKEITRIVCVADVADSLTGTGFILYDEVGSVGVFFDNGNAGATAPTDVGAAARQIEVNTQATGSTAQQMATALAAKLDADSKFVAVVDPDDDTAVLCTASVVGTRVDVADSADGATGFDFSVDQQGVAVVAEALTNAKLVLEYFPN